MAQVQNESLTIVFKKASGDNHSITFSNFDTDLKDNSEAVPVLMDALIAAACIGTNKIGENDLIKEKVSAYFSRQVKESIEA